MKPPPQDHPFTGEVMRDLFTNHELLAREGHRPPAPSDGEPGVRRVGILGGGTAGWFTALALRAQLPGLEVTVIETPSIPIIGVGEASVPSLVPFLHHYLKLDVAEFTREVAPTWKQGIRFEWGLPGDYAFQAPFDWEVNGVGMLGALAETANVSSFTLQGQLMAKGVTPIIRTQTGKLHSFLPALAFAYHLDNQRLVAYLRRTAIARGVVHLDAKIVDAKKRADAATEEPEIENLVDDAGRSHAFDLYVDCSGFRSFLLGDQLGRPFTSYASTLFTDRALAFNAPHGGKLKPYTTARTMQSGWCWDIPIREDDHLGYVYSSAFATDDEALLEAKSIWPDLRGERVVKFRSGRHDKLWVGNVFAVGNAYAFVEPLESTGLLMITRAITSLVRAFPMRGDQRALRRFVNTSVGRDWDRLRWFLAAHYKFNRRLDSKFWVAVRETCDISGLDDALALFRGQGPLSLLPRAIRASLLEETNVFFYGLHGLDCILLGQKVPFEAPARDAPEAWRARQRVARDFVRRAIDQGEAMRAKELPEWLHQVVNHPAGWAMKMLPFL